MLSVLEPKAPGAPIERVMLLTEAMAEILDSPTGDDEWEVRVGTLRADLERFVTNAEVIDPKYLFLLYPAADAVWEVRSVRDAPSIRVLGLFAKRDVFVATNFALREDLAGWQSREWKNVKRAARAAWNRIFGTYRPRSNTKIGDLVTGAQDGDYFKREP